MALLPMLDALKPRNGAPTRHHLRKSQVVHLPTTI
jgi:hypothetical protein